MICQLSPCKCWLLWLYYHPYPIFYALYFGICAARRGRVTVALIVEELLDSLGFQVGHCQLSPLMFHSSTIGCHHLGGSAINRNHCLLIHNIKSEANPTHISATIHPNWYHLPNQPMTQSKAPVPSLQRAVEPPGLSNSASSEPGEGS